MIELEVNGRHHRLTTDPRTPLLWVLRDALHLKGTKYGCGVGICGSCTVLVDGKATRACVTTLAEAAERKVTTIEALAANPQEPLLRSWIAEQVPQCGYCQPGALMAAAGLLGSTKSPSAAEITAALDGVLCRCGTYPRMRRAIDRVLRGVDRPAPNEHRRAPEQAAGTAVFQPNPWVRIAEDGAITIVIDRSEMGQGVATSLAMLVAEELEVDLAQVGIEFAPADPAYANPEFGEQVTGGSTSIRSSWLPLRRAGAEAREMLIAAAAAAWQVDASECRAEHGAVLHLRSERRLGYGTLAAKAAALPRPKNVRLKERAAFRLIGRPVTRMELEGHVTGRTVFGMDVAIPDMLTASVLRCPVLGGKPRRFDDRRAREVEGIVAVFKTGSGIAVVGRDAWSVLAGKEAVEVEWQEGKNAALDTDRIRGRLATAAKRKGRAVRDDGNIDAAFRRAATVIEAAYETPFLAHASMEPMNCTVHLRDRRCDVWVPTQAQSTAQEIAAWAAGLPREAVQVHTTFLGGGFGRRLEQDFVEEAVRIAKQVGKPVQVFWTREDDMRHDHYRPAHHARLRAAVDARGMPSAWFMRIAGPPLALDGIDVPYAFPNLREEHVTVDIGVPCGPWRSVGNSQNAFVVESFVDELAHVAGADPFVFRRDLLAAAPRYRAVLELAAEKAGWGKGSGGTRHQGIAVYHCFGSWVAQVAEVSVNAEGDIRVHRVVCAVDCGIAVNRDTIAAQMEGAIIFGLTATLKGEITLEKGRVQQSNFGDYRLVTLAETPEIEVHILASDEPPGGVGEPGVPPIAPAVANAVFAATGKRLRRLPLRATDLHGPAGPPPG